MNTPSAFVTIQTTKWLQGYCRDYIAGRVLDAGCGRKPFAPLFEEQVESWTGLDVRPVAEVMGAIEEMDYDNEFDTVLCTDVLGMCPLPHLTVNALARSVKPGGRLLITAPMLGRHDSGMYRFTPSGLEWLVRNAGLEPVESATLGGLVENEFDSWEQSGTYASPEPTGFRGFLGHMDAQYPLITVMVATKKE